MTPISHARFVLGIALLAGVGGDLLLRALPWGWNFTLWGMVLLGAVVLASMKTRSSLPRGALPVLLASTCSAGFLTLRDSTALGFWNVSATLLGAGLLAARMPSGDFARSPILDYLHALLLHGVHTAAGPVFLLWKDLRSPAEKGRPGGFPWAPVLRGMALTLPALLLFGGLLTSADATFEYVVREILEIDVWSIVSHLVLIGLFSWTVAGFLRGRFLAGKTAVPSDLGPRSFGIGITELGILVGVLDLLFLLFVLLQIPYLFGGESMVIETASLTYAAYARRGFFELVAVATLALPLLLGADWLLRKDRERDVLILRALSLLMCLFLLAMLASAVQRLWLYAAAYGLTEQRVHAAAFLAWMALLIVWFGLTVLQGERRRFPFGAILAGYGVLLCLNVLNPDALVAQVNINRAQATGTFDAAHASALSADAVPLLIQGLTHLPPAERGSVARGLLRRFGPDATTRDWRSWNYAEASARTLVRENRCALEDLCADGETSPASEASGCGRVPDR